METSGAQSYSSGAPCYRAPVRQQPQQCSINKSKILAVFEFCSILDHPKLLVMAWILIQKFFNSLILWFSMNEWMNEWMCIYTPHISHHVSWRFTMLLSEIGCQLVKTPLVAVISPYLISLTHPPMHEMWDETRDRPQHWELRALLFSIGVWVL